jgi:hypothetical protein
VHWLLQCKIENSVEEEEEEEYLCLSATFQYRVMSEDIFISPILFLQPLLVAAVDRRPA